jgi:bile acid:Na+ symporter, BASS family
MPTSIQFSSDSLVALNICLAIIMFGVSLEIKLVHFKELLHQKKAVLTGLVSQLVLLPFLTLLLVIVLPISKGFALGMILVAACPGGNVSNFFTSIAQGNVALSVSLTAASSLLAFVLTPLNFFIWASLAGLSSEVKELHIDFSSLVVNMSLILLLPLVAGMWIADRFAKTAAQIGKPIRMISILFLAGFIGVALMNNRAAFLNHFFDVFWIVLLHNGLALISAFYFSVSLNNSEATHRTIAIETAIQNSGLGLILIFTFFDGNASMALIAAWWGVWHLISGLAFSFYIRNRTLVSAHRQ